MNMIGTDVSICLVNGNINELLLSKTKINT